jgi:hypothetical protein
MRTKKIAKINHIIKVRSIVRRVKLRMRMMIIMRMGIRMRMRMRTKKRAIGMLTMMRNMTTRKMKKIRKVAVITS